MFNYDTIRVFEGIAASIGTALAREKAIQDLRISEQRYSLAQNMANIGSWDWDILTGKLIWSEKIEPMFGFKKGQFKGTYEGFLECVHPEDRDFVINSVNDCLKNKNFYETFLKFLFFEILNKEHDSDLNILINRIDFGKIPFLNGNLFGT